TLTRSPVSRGQEVTGSEMFQAELRPQQRTARRRGGSRWLRRGRRRCRGRCDGTVHQGTNEELALGVLLRTPTPVIGWRRRDGPAIEHDLDVSDAGQRALEVFVQPGLAARNDRDDTGGLGRRARRRFTSRW